MNPLTESVEGPVADPPGSVLLVGNFLNGSVGTYSVCEELAVELDRAGWRVLTTSMKRERVARFVDMVGTVWRRRHEYQIAHVDVFSGPAFVWAEAVCWLLRRLEKRYVLTLHGGALPAFARRWPGRVRRLLDSADAVTTPSRYLREELLRYRGDSQVVPNAMRIECYEFRRRDRPQPRLVWLRSFHDIYDPSLAPRVVALLKDEFPSVRLMMAGPDKGDGSLGRVRETAASLGVLDRIEFPGAIKKADVSSWLNQGDVFLNTASVDNTPVSVIEALACGLCVVSTNVGGLPYLLDHDHDALLVEPGDCGVMAAAVRRILIEPGLAPRLSVSGRQKAEEMTWACVMTKWDRVLKAAMARGVLNRPARAALSVTEREMTRRDQTIS